MGRPSTVGRGRRAAGPEHLHLVGHHVRQLSVVPHQRVVLVVGHLAPCDLLLGQAVLPLLGHGGHPDSLWCELLCGLVISGKVEHGTSSVLLDGHEVIGACRHLRGRLVANPMFPTLKMDLRTPCCVSHIFLSLTPRYTGAILC